jgi:hypothetical protein
MVILIVSWAFQGISHRDSFAENDSQSFDLSGFLMHDLDNIHESGRFVALYGHR